MSITVAILFALLLGAALPTQVGINASLRTVLGHPLQATLISFAVGLVTIALISLGARVPVPAGSALGRASPWMYVGGVLGALYVGGTIVLAPKLGAATMTVVVVLGQLLMALVIDHFGWLGFPQQTVTPIRLLGAVLLIGGVILVRRG